MMLPRLGDASPHRLRIFISMRDSQPPGIEGLTFSLHPLRQPAAIFFQQKASRAETFSEDAMRFLIARGARNPLLPHLILRGGEPSLRQHLDQPRLQIENEQRERRI